MDNSSDNLVNQEPKTSTEVNEIRHIKLPCFWQKRPSLWFAQVDAQFYQFGVRADTTKYYTVVAALDSNVLQQVADVIENPPATDKYEALKCQLIARFTDSQEKQLRTLLTDLELGDRQPSQLLREMKALAGNKIDEEVLRTLWLQRMPSQI
ncbi:hypothetical protein RN001_015872 [Aquatica leii]|uniref:DUF7041 domain-containing protein n=1 Tax=Aquatica leii TaxID=1421715 RepID=A0AAN7NZJ5_9COLE|nr:hypothetical protein RN001_015872 [Aquatica leii]